MKAESMGRKSRKIAKVRYKRGENVSKSVSNTGLVGYVNNDLSLSSGNILHSSSTISLSAIFFSAI